MNHLGRYLKKRLNELNMSEREISVKCGISHSYLNQLIKGINPTTRKNISPTLATFEKLSRGFGVSVDKLQRITRGVKVNDPGNNHSGNGRHYSRKLLRQIQDFQEFMLEIGLNKDSKTEEEWTMLISRIKKSIKDHINDQETARYPQNSSKYPPSARNG